MALLMHGDAAFIGQGLVAETIDLSELKGYRIGGTIHFVINNQIGFTTNADVEFPLRPLLLGVAKIVQAPILHVNGDDPEASVHVARIATEFRQSSSSDIVIDMFCYRRFGHNESDEPAFTQPIMYRRSSQASDRRVKIYADQPRGPGHLHRTPGNRPAWFSDSGCERLEQDFDGGRRPSSRTRRTGWKAPGPALDGGHARRRPRRGDGGRLSRRAEGDRRMKITESPVGLQRSTARLPAAQGKGEAIKTGGDGIDWATAEASGLRLPC